MAFKNNVSYTANREQLERFAQKIIEAGHEPDEAMGFYTPGMTTIITYKYEPFIYANHPGIDTDRRFGQSELHDAVATATQLKY